MEEFYNLSFQENKTDQQDKFDNGLVVLIKAAVKSHGLQFGSCFSDTILRDRIRSYYKTHMLNSKKRLMTMTANPTKPTNSKRLGELLELLEQIQKNSAIDQEEKAPAASPAPEPIEETPKLASESALPSLAAQQMLGKATIITLCDGGSIL
mmetsp:Transcript_80/g.138  ORF Transcript_80/g.138 Transcript_80/m.138 type:complete len:152 (+) Transcript_80:107-562(+)